MREFPDAEGLLMLADILICDWSSIAFDFLALNRPTIFLDVEPPFKNGFSLGKDYRFGAVVSDMDSMRNQLDSILKDPTHYFSAQGTNHKEITGAVYGECTDGGVAGRQWRHLAKLITRV